MLVIKYCTNVTTGTYLCTPKIKSKSPGSIIKGKQSVLIKEWENIIAYWKNWAKWGPTKQVLFAPKTDGGLGSVPDKFCNFWPNLTLEKVFPTLKLT